jgi:hypothetical protein
MFQFNDISITYKKKKIKKKIKFALIINKPDNCTGDSTSVRTLWSNQLITI